MSSISQLSQIAYKALSVIPTNHHHLSINRPSCFSFNQSGGAFPRYIHQKPKAQQLKTVPESPLQARSGGLSVRVFDDDSGVVAVADVVKSETIGTVETFETLKKDLVELFYGTERGLNASSETRAEIAELISKIEPKNPTPAPNDALSMFDGNWILVYTAHVGFFPALSSSALPLLNVDKISQSIDSENLTVENSVQLKTPLGTTSFGTNAKFDVRSPGRVQILLEEGVIGAPQITGSIAVRELVQFFGQEVDLSPFKTLITAVEDTAATIAKTISGQPPFKFPFQCSSADSWFLTTYLDEDLRISRGDWGSVFVFIKERSPLLT